MQPKEIKGNFDCSHNEINSIKEMPRTIKGFLTLLTKLVTLKGGPKNVETILIVQITQ